MTSWRCHHWRSEGEQAQRGCALGPTTHSPAELAVKSVSPGISSCLGNIGLLSSLKREEVAGPLWDVFWAAQGGSRPGDGPSTDRTVISYHWGQHPLGVLDCEPGAFPLSVHSNAQLGRRPGLPPFLATACHPERRQMSMPSPLSSAFEWSITCKPRSWLSGFCQGQASSRCSV